MVHDLSDSLDRVFSLILHMKGLTQCHMHTWDRPLQLCPCTCSAKLLSLASTAVSTTIGRPWSNRSACLQQGLCSQRYAVTDTVLATVLASHIICTHVTSLCHYTVMQLVPTAGNVHTTLCLTPLPALVHSYWTWGHKHPCRHGGNPQTHQGPHNYQCCGQWWPEPTAHYAPQTWSFPCAPTPDPGAQHAPVHSQRQVLPYQSQFRKLDRNDCFFKCIDTTARLLDHEEPGIMTPLKEHSKLPLTDTKEMEITNCPSNNSKQLF